MTNQEIGTRTYYHVAGDGYVAGDDLLCADRLMELGVELPYKWADDNPLDGEYGWVDSDVICLFDSLDEAIEFAGEYGGTILRIDLPEYADDVSLTKVDEGYTAARFQIPSAYITTLEAK